MSSAMGQSLLKFAAAKDWNDLPKEERELGSMSSLKTTVLKHFLELNQKQHVCLGLLKNNDRAPSTLGHSVGTYIYIYIYIYTRFQKGFHVERYIDR